MVTSFRSHQSVLDAARRLIVRNPGRLEDELGIGKALVGLEEQGDGADAHALDALSSSEPVAGRAGRVLHLRYLTAADELDGVARVAARLHATAGVALDRLAVLVRQNYDVPKASARGAGRCGSLSFAGVWPGCGRPRAPRAVGRGGGRHASLCTARGDPAPVARSSRARVIMPVMSD